jgi:hypothetical protein
VLHELPSLCSYLALTPTLSYCCFRVEYVLSSSRRKRISFTDFGLTVGVSGIGQSISETHKQRLALVKLHCSDLYTSVWCSLITRGVMW